MRHHKILAGLAGLGLAAGAVGATAATKAPPKNATITAVQTLKMKPNRYIQDGLRFNKDVYRVRSGGTVTVINNAPNEGPHTLSVVKKKDLPRTAQQAFNCKICETLGKAHGADPESNAPPTFPFLEDGVGQATPPNLDKPGDSGVTGEGKKGEKITFKVTAKKGSKLYFMCIIHPWMMGRIDVVG